jgi:4-hydroxy-2-oxoheptanedioate aldolase
MSRKVQKCLLVSFFIGFAILFISTVSQSQERYNQTIAKLKEGKPVFGIWSSNRDPRMARTIGTSKIDYVIYDVEHQPFDMHNFHQFVMNLRAPDGKFRVTPIIRIGSYGREIQYNNWIVKQALDLGAMGIVFPHIDTPEMAREAVVSMRYPSLKNSPYAEPAGHRGWAPSQAMAAWNISTAEYAKRADVWPLNPDGELLMIALIESPEAIGNLEKILSVPGVGAVFIGPSDLQNNMGYRGQGVTMPGAGGKPADTVVPEAEKLIQKALAACKARNFPTAILTNSLDVKARVEQGANMPTIGADGGFTPDTYKCLQLLGR